jgi:ribonuclease BN (tRNA processing enzyme)
MVQVVLLGTGTPILDAKRQQSALLVQLSDQHLLFDAGRGVTSQMARMGLGPQQISYIFITHHHYDHISDLGEFLMTAWKNGREEPVTIYGPPGTASIVTALFEQVFARDIAVTLFDEKDGADIRKLVQVQEVSSGWVHEDDHWRVLAESVDHGNGMGLSPEDWLCLGFRVEAEGKAIAISGDTVACDGLDRIAHGADCLIQCCHLAEAEITTPAFERLAKYVIASSGQVGEIAARNQVKKLVLTHIRPKSEAMMRSMVEDIRRRYGGELSIGEDLMVIQV